MRRLLLLLIVLAVVWPIGDAQADFKNGNSLWKLCDAPDAPSRLVRLGYVQAIADAMRTLELEHDGGNLAGYRACFPEQVTGLQVVDVVKKLLREHPEMRRFGAAPLVARALGEAFPCP